MIVWLSMDKTPTSLVDISLCFTIFNGPGEKNYIYVGIRDVFSIKSLVFFRTLMYLIRYIRVPVDLVPNVPVDLVTSLALQAPPSVSAIWLGLKIIRGVI